MILYSEGILIPVALDDQLSLTVVLTSLSCLYFLLLKHIGRKRVWPIPYDHHPACFLDQGS